MRWPPSPSAAARVQIAIGLALLVTVAGLIAGPVGGGSAVAWQQVRPAGRTLCGRGSPFAFWARLASPERLMVYFEGGGFCWDYRSCAPATSLFKDQVSDKENPGLHGMGILDLSNRVTRSTTGRCCTCRPAPATCTRVTVRGAIGRPGGQ
jgi:hypothetical protein